MDIDLQLIPRGGWHTIVEKARAAAAASGVRFFAGSGIDCISSVVAVEQPDAAIVTRQVAATVGVGMIDGSMDDATAFGGDSGDATGGVQQPGDTEDDDAGADAADADVTYKPIVPISDANGTATSYKYKFMASGSNAGRVFVAERVIFASGPQDNHKDLLTPQALAAAVYINSGCNGAAEFANEVQVPTDVALPGFNPATGKPLLA
ncbi:hypothetical protein OEZ86_010347 [Tetradesmus obliquus]|nr:hypothetical protein OEZ86_010347 [Tetradesmus obliquus]